MNIFFTERLRENLNPQIEIQEVGHHINDEEFGLIAAGMMDEMVQISGRLKVKG